MSPSSAEVTLRPPHRPPPWLSPSRASPRPTTRLSSPSWTPPCRPATATPASPTTRACPVPSSTGPPCLWVLGAGLPLREQQVGRTPLRFTDLESGSRLGVRFCVTCLETWWVWHWWLCRLLPEAEPGQPAALALLCTKACSAWPSPGAPSLSQAARGEPQHRRHALPAGQRIRPAQLQHRWGVLPAQRGLGRTGSPRSRASGPLHARLWWPDPGHRSGRLQQGWLWWIIPDAEQGCRIWAWQR